MTDSDRKEKVEKIAAICGIIWFALIIDACYTWFFSWTIRYLITTPLIIYATVLLRKNDGLVVTKQRRLLFYIISCLLFLQLKGLKSSIITPIHLCPILCFVFWNRNTLLKLYYYLKKFVVFYAIVSIIIEFVVLSGVWTKIPCITLPPQDNVQEMNGTINRFYGLFVIPEPMYGLHFYRAMGPLREGGHFSIFLGFVYFVEKAIFDKRSFWIILAGLLTLSPNFLILFLVTEGYCAIIHRRIFKTIGGISCFVIFVLGVVLYSPDNIKDEIIRIVLERSLEQNLENAESEGFMALLDGRTNMEGIQMWEYFEKRASFFSKMTGMDIDRFSEDYVLSDFRCLIVQYGYVGFFLIILSTIVFSFLGGKGLYNICLLFFGLFVMLTRAWMFQQLYIWLMILLVSNLKTYDTLRSDSIYFLPKKELKEKV